MKNTFLALAAALLFSQPARAEEVSVGLKTGLNITTFVGSDSAGAEQKAGLSLGGYVIFPVSKRFKVQAECLYSEKGAVYKYEDFYAGEGRIELAYLEIPVLARFDIESGGGAKPAIFFGPSFGIKIKAKAEYRTIGESSEGSIDHIKTLDPGIVLGGVIDMETSKGKVSLEARYTLGLTTIAEKTEGTTADIRNGAATLLFGYRF